MPEANGCDKSSNDRSTDKDAQECAFEVSASSHISEADHRGRLAASPSSANIGRGPRRPYNLVKAETVTKELRALNTLLNRAVDWKVMDKNPIAGVKDPKVVDSKPPRWYTAAEMTGIYDATVVAHQRDLWRLLANTGLRRSEVLHLRRRDIVGESIHVLSDEQARTKSGKWREVPINEPAGEALERLPGDDHVIPQVTPQSLTRAFAACLRRAGLDGNLHCLRHTYGSHLVQAGVSLRTVQTLMGHAHFSTTEKYAHLAPSHLSDSARKISL